MLPHKRPIGLRARGDGYMRRLFAGLVLTILMGFSAAQEALTAGEMSPPQSAAPGPCSTAYAGPSSKAFARIKNANGVWIRDNSSDTVVVFVHGIASDNVGAWLTASAQPCTYWPDLLASDAAYFKDVDIFVAGYYSQLDSGNFSIDDAAGQLFTALVSPVEDRSLAPLHRKNIVFLTHSLGGIVVRQVLQDKRASFDRRKVGLVLLGSPTRGSEYAKVITNWLGSYYNNSLLRDLSSGSQTLADIDARFSEWLGERKRSDQTVALAEFFESTFPKEDCFLGLFACKWLSVEMPVIVATNSSGNYSGKARRIGNTDHLTLVKPVKLDGGVHQEVRRFFAESFPTTRQRYTQKFGSVVAVGESQTMSWQKYGETSEWVMAAVPPCTSSQGQLSCGPWKRGIGDGFSASNPNENSIGFVVVKDELRSTKQDAFQLTDVYSPYPSSAKFDDKPVYSSIYRSIAYSGADDVSAIYIKTMHVQPVIYRANRTALNSTAKDIPTTVGEKVSVEVASSAKDALLVISSIAGEWSVPLAQIKAQDRYGVLRVDDIARGSVTTKVTLTVWPH
ncbi:esterase/lipase family protein [Paucibacter sp. M5-1]|uniref:esterase/lipase family protein n=1 Tax=Paucibacter sp. M5-1 TaxID=3015998 RepID=UPI0022B8C0BF|nr:hypothetical protein [Paucibacter sp. M5-1]MCZ7884994.1 hypothetical protein [Paucibacter sp. M5-1]